MATALLRVLTCDGRGCPARFTIGRGLTALTVLEHRARGAGWSARGSRNYCPQHKPRPGLTAWAASKAGAK